MFRHFWMINNSKQKILYAHRKFKIKILNYSKIVISIGSMYSMRKMCLFNNAPDLMDTRIHKPLEPLFV